MAEKQARTRVMRMAFNDVLGGVAPASSPEEPAVDKETGEVIEGEAVVSPANGLDWSRLWVVASDAGMDRKGVHDFFQVPDVDGALKDLAYARAVKEKKAPVQVVADLADELEAEVRRSRQLRYVAGEQTVDEAADAIEEEAVTPPLSPGDISTAVRAKEGTSETS